MNEPNVEHWDLFISHASEDKAAFVAPLAKALTAFGVNVWYDDYALKFGDSLSRSIDAGLARSNFGVVVLSPAFIAKRWPEYELRGLTSREMLGKKVILPLWHNVEFADVVAFSPTLADKVAVKTSAHTPVQIATLIIDAIRPDIFTQIQRRLAYRLAQRASAKAKAPPLAPEAMRDVQASPKRHAELSPELIGRIRLVRACLLGAYTHSMAFWKDGFQRDAHPSKEVALWEHIAAVYREYASIVALRPEQHEAVFRFILALSMHSDESSLAEQAAALPKDAREIISNLYRYSEPVYDIQEEPPLVAAGMQEGQVEGLDEQDKERFPRDLPEDLIRELLGTIPERADDE
ncbi:MAG TPA: toll/interleukin-1 receptor domain-containing protein [Polyangiaceae bacterium]|nr:toll/interleukin-1 receptor domain-containing protein [Polyangiaceae bacterium]